MTALRLRRKAGAYHLEGYSATLRTGGSMRRGEIRTGAGGFQLDVTDARRCGVVARIGGRPVLRLHPDGCQLPGPGGPARWSPSRGGGVLVREGGRIEVHQAGRPGAPVRVEVTGSWPELELVALAACFATLSRRRRRILLTVAILGATGNG
ncbi:hypothetical protein [Plantactinospora endophytica]|uniref:Uncharacterized protein n=1 Tax=Plantactinospora endophytica TaxID=673535 RepID=A0ABQ4E1R7_9ACTN|nr:hypothetical protein [Plantactinospora endophytica]GIG88655.1 hypothetical protein Pen02_35910 [Plantactinospora endophytica]